MPIVVDGTYDNGKLVLDIPASVHHARVRAFLYEEPDSVNMDTSGTSRFEGVLGTMPADVADKMLRDIEEAYEQIDEASWGFTLDGD